MPFLCPVEFVAPLDILYNFSSNMGICVFRLSARTPTPSVFLDHMSYLENEVLLEFNVINDILLHTIFMACENLDFQ